MEFAAGPAGRRQTLGTCSLSQLVLPGMPLASRPENPSFRCQAA
jgi:hypothetical protein